MCPRGEVAHGPLRHRAAGLGGELVVAYRLGHVGCLSTPPFCVVDCEAECRVRVPVLGPEAQEVGCAELRGNRAPLEEVPAQGHVRMGAAASARGFERATSLPPCRRPGPVRSVGRPFLTTDCEPPAVLSVRGLGTRARCWLSRGAPRLYLVRARGKQWRGQKRGAKASTERSAPN